MIINKYQVFGIWYLVIIFLLTTYYLLPTIVRAQEPCSDDSQCSEDTYYIDQEKNQCYHKHLGLCEPESQFADERGCVYAYDPEEDQSKCTTPEPTEEPSPTSIPEPQAPSSPPPEEQAGYNLRQGILPNFPKQSDCQLNILQQIIRVIFGVEFSCPKQFYEDARTLHQSELPREFTPTGNDQNKLDGFLEGKAGIYGASLPFSTDKVKETEQFYEKSHFPAGIRPITGQ